VDLIKADWCIEGDGGNYELATVAGGFIWMDIITRGIRGHPASYVDRRKGIKPVNAVSKMMKILTAMEKIDDWMLYETHPRLNREHGRYSEKPIVEVGTVEGGLSVHIVPDKCKARVDVRMLPSQTTEGLLEELNRLVDRLRREDSEEWSAEIRPFAAQHRTRDQQLPDDHAIVKEISKALEQTVPGQKPILVATSAGGRPDIWQLMPWVNFGCRRGGTAHAPDEYSLIEYQVIDTKFYAKLIENMLR
jgi:acetylornithine deacetylase/succinyl-diaminopimelate desuccinylase-like protein